MAIWYTTKSNFLTALLLCNVKVDIEVLHRGSFLGKCFKNTHFIDKKLLEIVPITLLLTLLKCLANIQITEKLAFGKLTAEAFFL